jgi:hypothetical protein
MFSTQESHMFGIRNARTEFVRFFETEQIHAVATVEHSTDIAAGLFSLNF